MFGISNLTNLKLAGASTPTWYTDPAYALNSVMPSLIHDYTKFKYWNSATGASAFPFATTRTTNAMQFDRLGRLIFAQSNLIPNTNFTSPVFFPNGAVSSVSDSLDPFSSSQNPVRKITVNNGISTVGADAAGGINIAGGQIPVNATTQYTFSFFAKAEEVTSIRVRENVTTGSRFTVNLLTGVTAHEFGTIDYTVSAQDFGNGWWRVATTRTTAVGATNMLYTIKSGDTVGDGVRGFLVSCPQVELTDITSPKPYTPTTGIAFHAPRFDYDPFTGNLLGLLVEDTRTNLVPVSLNTNAATFNSALSVLAATKVASPASYLGGWAAVRFTPDATTAAHGSFAHSITPPPNTKVTMHAIISPISGSTFYQMTGSGSWMLNLDGYVNFDCSGAGSITATGAGAEAAFIRRLAPNVYHIGVTVTTAAATSSGATCIVGFLNTGLETRLPGLLSNAVFDFIYGSHFEGANALGYNSVVPCFGTATTKGTDTFVLTSLPWLGASRGTFYTEVFRALSTGTVTYQPFSLSDNTLNNRIQIQASPNVGMVHRSGGTNYDYSGATGTPVVGQYSKIAVRYSAVGSRYVGNGGSVVVSGTAVAPVSPNRLYIGANALGTAACAWVRTVRYYNDDTALDAQLQALTA